MANVKEQSPTRVKTGEVRASFVKVFVAEKYDEKDEKGKFSLQVLIPKSDKVTCNALFAAQEAARQEGKAVWGGKIPAKLSLIIRDGDDPNEEFYAEREGCYFINMTSGTKPGVIGKAKDAAGKAIPLTEEEFYSGAYCKVSCNFFPYSGKQNGVACGLNNIFKTRDGDRLSGKPDAESDFDEELAQEDEGGADDFLD